MAKQEDLTWLIGPIAGILGLVGLALFSNNNNQQQPPNNTAKKPCGCQAGRKEK